MKLIYWYTCLKSVKQLKYLFTLRNAAAVQAPPDRGILPILLTSASCDSVTCFV